MSNSLAIATVTATFANLLTRFIAQPGTTLVPGARVTTLHPGAAALLEGDPLVNLHLFRVGRNSFVRNRPPTQAADGRPLASPSAMLDLDYMVTFFGNEAQLEAQRLLGNVIAGLNAEPILDRTLVQNTIAQTSWLAGSTLGDQPTPIRIVPMDLAPDVMARLWSGFVNAPYHLTVFYTASVVELDVPLQ
jgi:hypothetical protein